MPVTTTEVPTFFGPSSSPLLGVLHLPADSQIRAGVLICGSLGKEAMDSTRLHRILGDHLARRGFAVLRFDYLGTGDSAYGQLRDDAVANWVASVGHALHYLSLIGAEQVTAVGVRAGCLILDKYLAQSRDHAVNSVVYFDPTGSGRRYVREHTTLFRLLVGDYVPTPGEVAIIGGRLSEHAVAEFSALRVGADPVGNYGIDTALVVGRPEETDRAVAALASADGVESVVVGGLPDCARSREFLLPIPSDAVDAVIDWVDGNAPDRTQRAVPEYLTTATMPAEGRDGVEVDEVIERVEPNGLFAIRTRPHTPDTTPAKTVLFFVTNKDSHVGPNREWVDLSRRVAAAGAQALRCDPAGLGLSAASSRDPYRPVYDKRDVADSIAVAQHACRDGGQLEVVGICSGAWYAAQVARKTAATSAILINLDAWNWRTTSTLPSQWWIRRRALAANTPDGPCDYSANSGSPRLPDLLQRTRGPAKRFIHDHFPRIILRALSWIGPVWLPEGILAPLVRGGTRVTLIACPEDSGHFTAKGGPAALRRLQGTSLPPRLIAPPTGDHPGHHPAILAALREVVLPARAAEPGSGPARQRHGVGA